MIENGCMNSHERKDEADIVSKEADLLIKNVLQ